MSARGQTRLVVGIGDIHGRFHRVQEWIARLEEARGRVCDLVLAVGDVEAFAHAEDHRRKAAKRAMPAEFADYAEGRARMQRPMYFIGGNNEDFEALHGLQAGGALVENVRYLGRAGVTELDGLRVGFLSGIMAPKHFDTPLVDPKTQQTRKQAGYFRAPEAAAMKNAKDVDILLVHEWPKGLLKRRAPGEAPPRPLRAYRFPWIGNVISREVMEKVRPRWLMAGHSHVPFATSVAHPDGSITRVACLDQAAKPEGAVFWIEFTDGEAARAGWGIDGKVAWHAGEPFTELLTPDVAAADHMDPEMH